MTKWVTIFYLASTSAYFLFGNGHMLWAGFNMVTLLYCLMIFMRGQRIRGEDRGWVKLAEYVTAVRILYTIVCVAWPTPMIYTANLILGSLLIVAVAINIYHGKCKL
jgi:hypothetical protein